MKETYEKRKDREGFWKYMKEENEKKIEKLSNKEDINILYRDSEDMEEIFAEPEVYCENCKEEFLPSSILKHIGGNKFCKA